MDNERCLLCDELVEPSEAAEGTFLDTDGERRVAHRDCALRSVLGGIGHLENHDFWCKVRGDPDGGYSYRDSARLVRSWVDEHGLSGDDTPDH